MVKLVSKVRLKSLIPYDLHRYQTCICECNVTKIKTLSYFRKLFMNTKVYFYLSYNEVIIYPIALFPYHPN